MTVQRRLDFTISAPTNFQFNPPVQNAAPQTNSNASDFCASLGKKINHFLADPNDAPPYGYQDNAVTGIGFWLMYGARFAISVYKESSTYPSLWEQTAQKAKAIIVGVLSAPFTIIGALMKGIGSQFPQHVGHLTADSIPKTPAKKIDQIYELLQIVSTVFRENNIFYSMDGGTLLGAERHRGIIPWDDDGDLFTMDQDKERILALRNRLAEQGVTIQETGSDDLHICFDAATLQSRFGVTEKEVAHLDVFFMKEDHDGKIRPKSEFFKHQWPKEWFLREELQQQRDYPFGPPERGLFLKGPANPMRYLRTFYGPECFEYAIQTHSHIQFCSVCLPILNFSKTRYRIENPTFAEGDVWRNPTAQG